MIFHPRKTKFKKYFKGVIRNNLSNSCKISHGSFALQALEIGRITERQIESARKTISNNLRRSGRVWIKIFPNIPISKKPIESRMGKGKGDISHFICRVKPGKILFELDNISKEQAIESLRKSSSKIPIKTRIISILDNLS